MQVKLYEKDIKIILIKYLLSNSLISKNDVLINEFTIDSHSRRVDLLVVKSDLTVAYEIKSEADSLNRVEGQLSKYNSFFDKVVVVAAKKHIEILKLSTDDSIELWQVDATNISIIRKGKINKVKDKINLLKFIPANTLHKIAKKTTEFKVERTRKNLESLLVNLNIKVIRNYAISELSRKYLECSKEFMQAFGDGNNSIDISQFSRYASDKVYKKAKSEKKLKALTQLSLNKIDDINLLKLSSKTKNNLFGDIPTEIKYKYLTND